MVDVKWGSSLTGNVEWPTPQDLVKQVKQYNDTVYLSIFRWSNPATRDRPLTPAQAVEWLTKYAGKYALVELKESNGWLHLNAFTSGDMW